MADATDPRGGEIEVSPEEIRFLRGFVRREVLPWAGILLVISLTCVWWLGGDDAGQLEARTAAAMAQVRSENQKLRAELESLRVELAAAPSGPGASNELERQLENARQNVRMIETRVTAALERRIDGLEARLNEGMSAAASPQMGPPPDAAAWDVSAILDRLYALEMRLDAAQQGAPVPAAPVAPAPY